jgi:hypothetical protein
VIVHRAMNCCNVPIPVSIVIFPPPISLTRFQTHLRLEMLFERVQTLAVGVVRLDTIRKVFLFDHGHALMVILVLVSQLWTYID